VRRLAGAARRGRRPGPPATSCSSCGSRRRPAAHHRPRQGGRHLRHPGTEGSTAKLQWAELNKRITSFTIDLLGPEGLTYPGGYRVHPARRERGRRRPPHKRFLRARANSIEGGTSEIMKNILGERVLGLPGEPRVDKNVPWREVPRS
jgi:alkylation response protein AidB-like acyl-CoA dehydrogenase